MTGHTNPDDVETTNPPDEGDTDAVPKEEGLSLEANGAGEEDDDDGQ